MQDEASVISSMSNGQSRIVSWNGMSILVYIGQNDITVNDLLYPDVYLTDVSNATQLQALLQPGYTAPPQGMLDTLPQAVTDTIAEDAAKVGALVNSAGQYANELLQKIAGAAGQAAESLVSPLVPILVGAIVLIFLVSRR